MVLCYSRVSNSPNQCLSKQMMFASRANGLAPVNLVGHSVKQEPMASSPISGHILSPTHGEQQHSSPPLEGGEAGSVANSHPTSSYDLITGTTSLSDNSTSHHPHHHQQGSTPTSSGSHFNPSGSTQQHYISMYNGNALFGGTSSGPSSLVMTPPSPYTNDIMGPTENSLMQHSNWYSHPSIRGQHHPTYSDMFPSAEWTNPLGSANSSSFVGSSTTTPLAPYQMPYSASIGPVYHHHPHSHHSACRPSSAAAAAGIDLYDGRFGHNYYYSNAFFNSGSPTTGAAAPGHTAFTPLSVGTEVSQMPPFVSATGNLNHSSPDSGVTVSSEGHESPTLNSGGGGNGPDTLMSVNGSIIHSDGTIKLEEDLKGNSMQSMAPTTTTTAAGQEATSTTAVSSSGGARNAANNSKMYTWMNKSTNSNQSQLSTGNATANKPSRCPTESKHAS